ncbi:unnamed protein product [Acanthoscelides obtectus]|uniref:Regulatory protein zeste n=1 Tax=Acanthoscelides obtectus TaxID=200917 RepID=A0A9P0LZJ4_ACAOB|nr:unnamed protein product [Acanthoscelides obtectus]CAK1633364.1 Myb/SANT-like DNA-binding domain-containing protein 3 [Acanthoscelides obtectus]
MSAPKRTSNFSREEESLLIRLVNKYKDVIECRKTDAVTNSSTAKTWNMIAKEFNSGAVTYRDSKTLKNMTISKKGQRRSSHRRSVPCLLQEEVPQKQFISPILMNKSKTF